jgi:8-oxo-dGTP diphosphatase
MKIINTKNIELKEIYGPAVAVDTVLFCIDQKKLKVLLIKINQGPYAGKWALPGGLVQLNETLDEAAKRVLFQKTNIGDIHLEQLYSFGDLTRDSRGRIVSVAYFALVPDSQTYSLKTMDYYDQISWKEIDLLPALAFDHKKIIEYALERLQSKLEYTNIVYSLLPKQFTLTQLQFVYEIITGQPVDKRNFRKKIIGLNLVKSTGKVQKYEAHRPAELYQFTQRKLIEI